MIYPPRSRTTMASASSVVDDMSFSFDDDFEAAVIVVEDVKVPKQAGGKRKKEEESDLFKPVGEATLDCAACPLPADTGSLCKKHKRVYECICNDAFPRSNKKGYEP